MGNNLIAGLACAGGCLAGILLSPDLDQQTISSAEYTLIKYTLGLGYLWTMLWHPYALLCKHRSPISHWPILGTASRLAYISVFLIIAMSCGWHPPDVPLLLIAWVIFGLVVSDTAHWFMDFHLKARRRRK